MSGRIPTPCTYIDAEGPCPEYAVDRGRCEDHPRAAWAHSRSAKDRGYDAAWRKLSARNLREHPLCVVCGRPATSSDHIIPLAEGGARLDPGNVQSLCDEHHGVKTSEEALRGRLRTFGSVSVDG